MFLPTSLRKLFSIFRGGATPLEIGLAITLGVVMGMLPGFSLLHICIIFVALLINIPAGVFILSFLFGKLISYPLTYVTFAIGKALLSIGFIEAILRFFVNAPVTAWMDLDRYCTIGGIPLGIAVGVGLSILMNKAVMSFRRKMAAVEAGSEAYKKYASKPWVKILAWVFLGKGLKKGTTYADILEKKTRFIRKGGVIVAVVFLVIILAVEFIFAAPIVRSVLISQMEQANGATVDIDKVDLSLFQGHCILKGIQVCDPDHLNRNLVSVSETRIDFGVGDLLRKRFVIDEIGVIDAAADTDRATPGRRLREPAQLPPGGPPGPGGPGETPPDKAKTIYDYLKDAQQWKEKIERWYKMYQEYKPKPGGPPTEEEIRIAGYRNQRASYLVAQSPRLLIKKITVGGLILRIGGTETKLDLLGTDFSTNAKLAGANPLLKFNTRDGNLNGTLMFSLMDTSLPNLLNLEAKNVNLADVQKILNAGNAMKFDGGTATLVIKDGRIGLGGMDVPLAVKLADLKASAGDKGIMGLDASQSQQLMQVLNNLDTSLHFRGKPYAPYVMFDEAGLAKSFKEAAKKAGLSAITDSLDKYKPEMPEVPGFSGGEGGNKPKLPVHIP
jgi:uncharacterized protein (TIGR03546 family)